MTPQDRSGPMWRLKKADPARTAPPADMARIRTRLRSSAGPARSGRRHPVLAGAVAASLLVIAGSAGAGVYVGRSSVQPSASMAVANPSGQVGDGSVSDGSASTLPAGPGSGMAGSNGALSAQPERAVAGYPGFSSGMVAGEDLPDTPGRAPGYRLTSANVDRESLAQQLAAAFNVSGEPAEQEYGWAVGPTDGSGPSLWISDDALVSWSFTNPQVNPWACTVAEATPPTDAGTGAAATTSSDAAAGVAAPDISMPGRGPEPAVSCPEQATALSQSKARQQATDILGQLGVQDGSTTTPGLEWETGSDGYTTWVTAWQLVEGTRTQLNWSLTFAGDEVAWANGFAAGLEATADFPVLGARSAVQRASDPRFISFGPTPTYGSGGGAVPLAEAQSRGGGQGSSSKTPAAAEASGVEGRGDGPVRVQVWWDPSVAVAAKPTLAQYWQPDGTLLILPAYELETADERGTWVVIAIDSSVVDLVPSVR